MASAQNDFLSNRCQLIWQFLDPTFVLKIAQAAHTNKEYKNRSEH